MNRYFSKFIFLTLIGFVFAVQINAQLCGRYTTTLQIKTADEKPVGNAVVQLLPIEKDETRGKSFFRDEKDLSKFSITFFEGHQLSANYKLLISADGFENLEKEIKFPHCKNQTFDIQLNAKQQNNSAVLSGTVFDANGAVIINAKITATNEKGEKFETVTNTEGVFNLKLPYNPYNSKREYKISKYEITVEHMYFEKYVLKNFNFVPAYKDKMILDFALNIASVENCGAGGCVQVESNPIESSNQTISDKILKQPLEE